MTTLDVTGYSLQSADELFFEIINRQPNVPVYFHAIFDQTAGVEDRTVIATAKGLADGLME